MDKEKVQYLSKLSMLHFDEGGLDRMAADLTKLDEVARCILQADVSGIQKTRKKGEVGLSGLRADVKQPSIDAEKLKTCASIDGNCFVVPKVIE